MMQQKSSLSRLLGRSTEEKKDMNRMSIEKSVDCKPPACNEQTDGGKNNVNVVIHNGTTKKFHFLAKEAV